jgi:diguanylate cyclase (GGDEF)-like protein
MDEPAREAGAKPRIPVVRGLIDCKGHRMLLKDTQGDLRCEPAQRGAESSVQRRPVSTVWSRTLALMIVVVLGLGAAAFASTLYQRAAFDATTSQLESELDAVVSLVRELRTVDVPMGSIFYQFGTPAELEGQVQEFNDRRRQIDAAFDHAQQVVPVRSKDDPLAAARASWEKTAGAVLAAKDLWGTSTVQEALASGTDPYSKEWTQLRDAQGSLTEVTEQSLGALRAQVATVDQVQQLIPLVVIAALVLTFGIGALAARRLSRHIVTPLMQLRHAALRMREGDLLTTVDLGPAAAELRDLAGAMNDLASSLHTSHALLLEQAHTDALTGLPNRKAMTQHLQRHDREGGTDGMALLFIDLDDFKVVNDTLGHAAGDRLLTIVGARLQASSRDCDLVARLGGDEFAIALGEGQDPAAALAVAERLLASLSEPVAINGTAVGVGCSIGIALSGPTSAPAEELLRNADIAMYMAKGRGKNRLELFAHTMHNEMLARMNLKADLSHAVERDQLELHYQPVLDLAANMIVGWEALVRWQHPERGLIPPVDFIPTAEDTGDILAIGRWVLDRACRDFADVLGCSGEPDRWVSVNVSPRQLQQPGFDDAVRQALERHGVDPRSLILEITEEALVTSTADAADTLTNLQREGIRVAIDDFGTGFSSLRYLQQLPVDIIKIDRCFLAGDESAEASGVLDAIVTLGATLGLTMIAEGIEDAAEQSRLQKFRGMSGQGYFFARPMPIDRARTFAVEAATRPQTGGPGARPQVAALIPSPAPPPRRNL